MKIFQNYRYLNCNDFCIHTANLSVLHGKQQYLLVNFLWLLSKGQEDTLNIFDNNHDCKNERNNIDDYSVNYCNFDINSDDNTLNNDIEYNKGLFKYQIMPKEGD